MEEEPRLLWSTDIKATSTETAIAMEMLEMVTVILMEILTMDPLTAMVMET
ncbi:hypothetical protein G9A89_002131 [Geosiphon pyriformis]|nr:hypothetical protein G9A89_002131 [Geosiphon pyriformis]